LVLLIGLGWSSLSHSSLFLSARFRRAPRPTLFPYTTLFRSLHDDSFTQTLARGKRSDFVWFISRNFSAALPLDLGRRVSPRRRGDRKSTRLNSSHVKSSYAVFCLKKKNHTAGVDNVLAIAYP